MVALTSVNNTVSTSKMKCTVNLEMIKTTTGRDDLWLVEIIKLEAHALSYIMLDTGFLEELMGR